MNNLSFISFLLAVCCSCSFALRDAGLLAAQKYVNDKRGLIGLYQRHAAAKSKHEKSELEDILYSLMENAETVNLSSPKHIVTILTDDQGWGDIGYNDDTFVTPTIDMMASRGVKFNSFYVQSTCSPTRASLLTGRDVSKTGLQDGAIIPGESRALPLDMKTAGNYFKDAGYSTNFIGKWHLGQKFVNETPNARGYDYFFGLLGGAIDMYGKDIGLLCGSEENNFTAVFADNCQVFNGYDFQENGTPFIDTTTYASELLADKATEAILKHDASKPMLMHYHTNAPHTPLDAPPELLELCSDVTEGTELAIQPYFRKTLCGMVTSIDIDLLRIVLALRTNDMLSSTLFLYHADNGGLEQAGSVNLPFRSQKGALFDGGIHVPAFMFGNGLHLANRIKPATDDLVYVADMLPTLLGYAGVDSPLGSFDGYNLWPRLSLGLPLPRRHIALVAASESLGYFTGYIQEILGTRWKYVFNPSVVEFIATSRMGQSYEVEGEMLFDLTADPYETTNLVQDKNLRTLFALNVLRVRALAMRLTSVPSQLTEFPPVIDVPPSPTGCWLPLDSPLFGTAVCPVEASGGLGVINDYDRYVTADLDL